MTNTEAELVKTGVKMLGEDRIGGYLVVWGDASHKDLQGEYFTKETDLGLDWYQQRPALYHHGLDGNLKAATIGSIDTLKADEIGIWAEAQLDMRKRYVQAVQKLVQRGALSWSSGSLPHLVEVESDGRIKRWPIVEGSLTPAPAEPRHTHVSELATIKTAYKELDLPLEKLELALGEDSDEEADIQASETDLLTGTPKDPEEDKEDPADKMSATASDEDDSEDEDPSASIKTEEPEDFLSRSSAPIHMDEQPESTLENQESDKMSLTDSIKSVALVTASALGLQLSDEGAVKVAETIEGEVAKRVGVKTISLDNLKAAFEDNLFRQNVAKWVQDHAKSNAFDEMGELMKQDAQKSIGQGGESKVPASHMTVPNVNVMGRLPAKYAKLESAEDMAYLYHMRKGYAHIHKTQMWQAPDVYWHEMADRANKSIDELAGFMRTKDENDLTSEVPAIKAVDFIRSASKSDELNFSTQVGYGDEWVPDLWLSRLWLQVERDSVIAQYINVIDMPSNPYILPLEGDDPEVFSAPETEDESDIHSPGTAQSSKVPTGKTTINAYKLGLRSPFSNEFNEDAIIQFIPELRRKQLRSMLNAIDYVVMNADDSLGTQNINLWGYNVQASDKKRWQLGFDGIAHYPLVDDVAGDTLFDMGNAIPTLAKLREVQSALHENFLDDEMNLVWFVTPRTRHIMKSIDEFVTVDKYGPNATVLTGEIGKVDGVAVISAGQLKDGDSTGVIHQSSANNNRGRAVLLYRPYYYVGYRRRIQTWFKYYEENDAYQMGAWLRVGMVRRDTKRQSVAMLKNIAI